MKTSICVVAGLLISLFIGHSALASGAQSLDRIIAIINDAPITASELDKAIETMKKQFAANNVSLPADDVLHKQVLDQLINKKLQLQLAENANVKVTDAMVNKAISHIAQSNNMSLDQLYEQVAKQGLTPTEYRKEIRDEIMLQEVQQHEVASKITISPQEVKDFMRSKLWQASNSKEYHLEDILISLPEAPSSQQIQDAKKTAQNVLAGIRRGTPFHEAAVANSSGNKALEGGDLGWRKLPEIPSAFAEQIVRMQKNDISEPIQTSNGFHIIHLADVRDLTSAKPDQKQIQQLIYQRKMEEALQVWMTKIRSEAFINLHPEGT